MFQTPNKVTSCQKSQNIYCITAYFIKKEKNPGHDLGKVIFNSGCQTLKTIILCVIGDTSFVLDGLNTYPAVSDTPEDTNHGFFLFFFCLFVYLFVCLFVCLFFSFLCIMIICMFDYVFNCCPGFPGLPVSSLK